MSEKSYQKGKSILNKNIFNRKGTITTVVVVSLLVLAVAVYSVYAAIGDAGVGAGGIVIQEHTPVITIYPSITNCNPSGNKFIVTVGNDASSNDSIFEVRIYNGTEGVDDFKCGPAPVGWTLFDFVSGFGYCEYKTPATGLSIIDPGESVNFTFNATLNKKGCKSVFLISTLDDARPSGEHEFTEPFVTIDCVPPETDKKYGKPFVENGNYHWINNQTPITFTAEDFLKECETGVVNISWRNTVLDISDSKCTVDCDEQGEGPWNVVQDDHFTIYKPEESCHLIEFYATDEVGNNEEIQRQCVFVDLTPPTLKKYVGQPSVEYDDNRSEGDDFYVTQDTNITLYCKDQGPHPSDNVTIYWKYRVNEGQGFGSWKDFSYNGGKVIFNFPENSEHEFESWCVDAVGLQSEKDHEFFKVDSEPPTIKKMMFGSWLGDCPPQNESDVCYVADNDQSGVSVWVDDGNNVHAVDRASCEYQVIWHDPKDGDDVVDSGKFEGHKNITFKEDSNHTLIISCQDALGNKVEDREFFRVDSTPPRTKKTYGEPFVFEWYPKGCYDKLVGQCNDDRGCFYENKCFPAEFISKETPVTLEAWDNKVGVNATYWRNLLVRDNKVCGNPQYCNPEYYSQFVDPSTPWNVYTKPFNKTEESCHVIEFYSEDKLGNEEKKQWQCVFVDDTAPAWKKEIGKPHFSMCLDNVSQGGQENPPGGIGVDGIGVSAVGDEIDTITFPEGGGTGVGVAFDGEFLYYTYISSKNLYKIRPDGTGHMVINTTGILETGLGALSYDATRGMIWAGTYGCRSGGVGPVYLIDPVTGNATFMFSVPSTYINYCLDDGIAYDAKDDSIWYSDDIAPKMVHLAINGTVIEVIDLVPIDARLSTNSGIAIGGDNFYLGTNGKDVTIRANRSFAFIDEFVNTGFRIEDMECDPETFSPIEVMWIRDAYAGQARAYEIEPQTCGLGGEAPGPSCNNSMEFVSLETPITMSCKDQDPHPVDHARVCFRVSFDDPQTPYITEKYCDKNLTENGYCCAGSEVTLRFKEESFHDLDFYCEDGLGNKNKEDIEFFKVDATDPNTKKTYKGPFYTKEICEEGENGDLGVENGDNGNEKKCYTQEYIDTASWVVLNATDPAPHPSGVKATYWRNNLVPNQYCEYPEKYCQPCDKTKQDCGNFSLYTGPFNKSEESCHLIEYYSVDNVGNQEDLKFQCAFVDKRPPITEKRYKGPLFIDEETGREWISNTTQIWLSAYDQEPHPSGVNTTYYRNTLVNESFCQNQEVCQNATGNGNWETWNGTPKYKNEESCHLIEYYSVDNVNKTERVKKQCAFVDLSPPEPNKTVGEPKTKWNGNDSVFYKDETKHCWDGTGNEIECWKVTILTPITLDCKDPQPHPVDHETACFKVGLDGDDMTKKYCWKNEGKYNESGNGYCCLSDKQMPKKFYFKEESEHNLKFYCTDALGNKGPVDEEKFKVEGTKFTIWLNKKWNLVSVPFVLIDSDVTKVFNDIKDNVEAVYTYDASLRKWFVYRPGANGTNNLETIEPGRGYWVMAKNDTMLMLGGSLFNPAVIPPSRELVTGWNLIGYYGNDDGKVMKYDCPQHDGKKTKCALDSLVEPVGDGNPRWSALVTYCESKNPHQWEGLDVNSKMNPGAGYWVFLKTSAANVNQDYVYAPSTCSGI